MVLVIVSVSGLRARPRPWYFAGLTALLSVPGTSAAQSEGFHKDLFMDCGRHLLCATPHAAQHLKLRYEIMRASSNAAQTKHIVGHKLDYNGVLLYPDGAPRYRAVYINGGESKDHGRSLGKEGLARFRDFYLAGGSYTGSCAGAFIASSRRMNQDMQETYFSIWPGETRETWFGSKASSWYIGPSSFKLDKNSPLLNYHDFGNDLRIDAIKHYEGPYALESEHWPKPTEVLARFDMPKARFHGTPSVWAYKPKKDTGRMVVVASHPENYNSGERRDLMAAIYAYALDGVAPPRLKGQLEAGKRIEMRKDTQDKDPCLTKIGDGQLHHFAFRVPANTPRLELELVGDPKLSTQEPADLHLYARHKSAAWPSQATHKAEGADAHETLIIEDPQPGLWFVAVLGATRVNAPGDADATKYAKNQGALNGIGYSLSLRFDEKTAQLTLQDDADPWCDRFIDELEDQPDSEKSSGPSKEDPSQDASPKDESPSASPESKSSPSPDPTPSSSEQEDPATKNSESSVSQDPEENNDDSSASAGCAVREGRLPLALLSVPIFLGLRRRVLRKVPASE